MAGEDWGIDCSLFLSKGMGFFFFLYVVEDDRSSDESEASVLDFGGFRGIDFGKSVKQE